MLQKGESRNAIPRNIDDTWQGESTGGDVAAAGRMRRPGFSCGRVVEARGRLCCYCPVATEKFHPCVQPQLY